MCFGIVNHAKLCVFYQVLMCLKVVIEDQVEDTKFAQEKHIFSMDLDSCLIEAKTYYLLDSSSIDRDFVLNRSLIDRALRISKNQQCEKAYNLFL